MLKTAFTLAKTTNVLAHMRVPSAMAWALEPSWAAALKPEMHMVYFTRLRGFIDDERQQHMVFPAADKTFAAFDACAFDEVSLVILGQDPYPTPGYAHGLSFSVPHHVWPLPGSLRNIFVELKRDLGVPLSSHGNLQSWADQGVLLLNSALSVRAGEAASHSGRGWERLTDAAISALAARRTGLVFLLWGAHAQRKAALIDPCSHLVLRAPHPSPLSAHRGFHGCAHFSSANRYLAAAGRMPIDWSSHLRHPASPVAGAGVAALRPPSSSSLSSPTATIETSGLASSISSGSGIAIGEGSSCRSGAGSGGGGSGSGGGGIDTQGGKVARVPMSATESSTGGRPGTQSSAPAQWWKQLQAVERARSARTAPVDFLGIHLLGLWEDGPAAFRFQTLAALMLSARTRDAATAHAVHRLRLLAAPLDGRTGTGTGTGTEADAASAASAASAGTTVVAASHLGRARLTTAPTTAPTTALTAAAVADLDEALVRQAIGGVSFAGQKASRLLEVSRRLVEEHDGDVPRELAEVLSLPGVGPKTAHLLMQVGWGVTEGIAVDTHVHRIAARLGWTRGARTAEATRKQLEAWLPREHWQELNPLLVGFGQQVCTEKPACHACPLVAARVCPQIGVEWSGFRYNGFH